MWIHHNWPFQMLSWSVHSCVLRIPPTDPAVENQVPNLLNDPCEEPFLLKIKGIVWLSEIVEKLAVKHRVKMQEVEEILAGCPVYRYIEKGHRRGENVYAAMGQTRSGRYLITFFVFKADHRALVVSARDMTSAERTRYEKTK